MLDICLLGTGGMMPTPNRFLASMMLRYNGTNILIDCGEGTQISLQKLGWGFKDINTILLTHYHGDHITGFPGLIWQMMNANRTEPLTVIGPPGIEIMQNFIKLIPNLNFYIDFYILSDGEVNNLNNIRFKTLKVQHTTNCYSYSFEIDRLPEFDAQKAKDLNIPVKYWNTLQHGCGVEIDGNIILPSYVLSKPRKGLKVAYSTDCRPSDNLSEFVGNSDLFIGEGMYVDELDKAKEKKHSTFEETAKLAYQAQVKELWLTHFSPSLPNPEYYLSAATKYFSNTKVGKDLMNTSLKFE